MLNLPSFLAMFCKHFINVVYFIQVLGWNKVFSYLKHEFFTIRNCRSFLGGHFSNRTPSFLLVPLRAWLGAVWVFEGVMKIVEGWFSKPMLTGFFGGATAWYNNILYSAGAAGVTPPDAVSSVTGAASSAVSSAAEAISSATPAAAGAGFLRCGGNFFRHDRRRRRGRRCRRRGFRSYRRRGSRCFKRNRPFQL
jgi:NADH dehydrogenase